MSLCTANTSAIKPAVLSAYLKAYFTTKLSANYEAYCSTFFTAFCATKRFADKVPFRSANFCPDQSALQPTEF